METNLENLNKAAVTNGVIIGILSVVIGIVTYYVAPSMMGSAYYGIGLMLVSLILYILFTIDLRKKIGGYWSFRQALRGIFLMAFTAGLLGMIINFLFYKFIEPGAYEKISGYLVDGLTKTYENLGMEQDKIDEAIETSLKSMKSQFDPSFTDLLRNLGVAVILQFVMSLIFAAIFKKERPVFSSVVEE